MFCSHVRYVCLYVCMYVCMHVCTKSFLKTTTNSSCVCTHLANKADSDSDSDPCCLCTFSYPNSSFQSTLHLICFDTALCKQPHLSVMTFCDLPSLWRVSMFVLDHCQVSSLLHYCGFKEQEIPRIYTVGMVINSTSNVNILNFEILIFHFHEL